MCDPNGDVGVFGTPAAQVPSAVSLQNPTTQTEEGNSQGVVLLNPSGGSKSGSENIAKVHRAQWDDYVSRFAPMENKLFARFYDEENKAEAVEKAGKTMATAFDNSKEQADRKYSRYGLNMGETQTNQRDKKYAINKAANVAGAQNGMRVAKEDQRMGIMSGGLSSVSQQRGS